MIRPLCGRVSPFVGKSLASIVARSACANDIPSTAKLLRQGVKEWGRPAFVAFTHVDAARDLAVLLGLSVDDVVNRMHAKTVGERSNRIDWFGTPLERRFLEAPKRRFSPLGLELSDFVSAEWMIRPLAYCPETFDRLRHECPHCDAQLGWDRALGVSVCEKCDLDIRLGPAHLLSEERRPAYSVIAGLISTEASRRAESVERVPDRFRAWQPGDLFSAIVDLGFARGCPETPSSSALANGDFRGFTEEHLFLGYDLLMHWDNSIQGMLKEIIRGQGAASSRGTPQSLGMLRRFFYANATRTALVDLMRAEVPTALRNLNMPLRVARNSVLLGVKREGTLSLRDARERYRIDNRLLARLVDKADCFIARHDSKFGTRLFHEERLAEAISSFRSATSIEALSRELGVPPCIVEACENLGLFERVAVRDAQLLAGSMILYETSSVRAFIEAFERSKTSSPDLHNISFLEGMRGEIIPEVWALILKALAEGKLAFQIDRAAGAWSSSIRVNPSEIEHAIAELSSLPLPKTICMSMGNAAVLLGISPTSLGCAARAGLLTAERHESGYSVTLGDLDAFRSAFVFNQELNEAYAQSGVSWRAQVKRAGLKPVALLGGRHCWNRRALEAVVGRVARNGIGDHKSRLARNSESSVEDRYPAKLLKI